MRNYNYGNLPSGSGMSVPVQVDKIDIPLFSDIAKPIR
jgi:hypothetical protein